MSISRITYANRIKYTDKYNMNTYSSYTYRQASTDYMRTQAYKEFSLNVTGSVSDMETIKLIEYANGNYVELEYSLYTNEFLTMYYLRSKMNIKDAAGNVIESDGYYDTSVAWADTPTYVTTPFSQMYYVSSMIYYNDLSNNTVAGDPARTIYPAGQIFYKKPEMPTLGYVDFNATNENSDFIGSYTNIPAAESFTSDSSYDDYYNTMDAAGDGTTWRDTGEEPEEPGGTTTGGGDGTTVDDEGVAVDFPDLPATSVISTALITLYNPTAAQLVTLANKLWSNDFYTTIQKVLNDPFDGVIGLSMVPYALTNAGTENCMIGNYDTEIAMPLISSQYKTLDCGTITVTPNWSNALDYNATTIEIFVPFVGFRTLNIQDCMGKTLALKYNVDVLTGSGVAMLKCGNKVMYTWPCNLSYDIPLTGSNKQALYTGLINVALTGAGGLAAGGAMGGVMGAATSAINTATHSQSNIERSGSIVSNTSMLSDFTPYIVLHRPNQSLAANFKNYKGYQSNITASLSSCNGYTEVEYIHLTGINGATDTELNEIEQLLKSGVII